MSIELITLRMATREVNYHQRVCEDAVKFGTSDKESKLPRYKRNLKKAQELLTLARTRCEAGGIVYTQADLPRNMPVA